MMPPAIRSTVSSGACRRFSFKNASKLKIGDRAAQAQKKKASQMHIQGWMRYHYVWGTNQGSTLFAHSLLN
jgi:hypothetical protein